MGRLHKIKVNKRKMIAVDSERATAVATRPGARRKPLLPVIGILLLVTAIISFFNPDESGDGLATQPAAVSGSAPLAATPPQATLATAEPVLERSGVEAAAPLSEATLPLIFSAAFNEDALDTATWAYHILKATVVPEGMGRDLSSNSANLVLQLGHAEEWSVIILEGGHNWRNYIVEMDVRLLDVVEEADNFFLGVRYDRNAGEYTISLDKASQMARLGSTINSLWEGTLHETPLALNSDGWYRIKAHVEDHLITFHVDDNHVGTIDNDLLPAGSIRMLTPPGSFVYIDNITVREIPSLPEPGDLLITEFMFRDDPFQWFEIVNNSDKYVRLDGMEITNGRETHIITSGPLVIEPRRYMIFASQDTAPHFSLDSPPYIYGDSLRFSADNGRLRLSANGLTITEIEYSEDTGWLLQDGVSVALHPDYLTSRRQNNGFYWCPSVQKVSDNPLLRATPGQPNHLCVRELPIYVGGDRQSGDLVITEIMIDLPGDDQGREWFEVYNPGDTALSLQGWTIATDSPAERHIITEDFNVPPGGHVVLAQAGLLASELPEDLPVYYYSGQFGLRNESGELTILDGERLIDRVTWRDNGWWPYRGGMSMSLHPDATSSYSNDDALNWCLAWTPITTDRPDLLGTPGAFNDPCPMWEINSPLQDVPRAYESSTLAPIPMYLTVDPQDLESMQMNPFSDREYPAQFTADGYVVGKGNNATMRPRGGNYTRAIDVQSYRIRLEEPFQGQLTLSLNKHYGDPSRLRNALSFRLFQGMNDITSLRTQFVHLFVNGEDLGLYTLVESRGSRMLRNHRLDDRGHLFNAEYGFFIYNNVDRVRRIESILGTAELEVGYSHDGLIRMIDAVYSDKDINQVIDDHFNRENLLTYFASVYLMQNLDTEAKNYLLYTTPREPERVYFLPWDWDNAFSVRETRAVFVGRWREGFGNWSKIGIMWRVLQEPELVDALVFKMLELAQSSLSQERVSTLIDQLATEVETFTQRPPDNQFYSPAVVTQEVIDIKGVIGESARLLAHTIQWPIPPQVNGTRYNLENNAVEFLWYETISLQGRPLSYEVVLFSERLWDEDNIIWRSPRTTHTSLTITTADIPDELSAGRYYWMVYVWDNNGNYNSSSNTNIHGEIDHLVDLP